MKTKLTKNKKSTANRTAKAVGSGALVRRLIAEIPTTWLDPLLTGPSAVIGNPPYDGGDIERLLRGIKARMESHA